MSFSADTNTKSDDKLERLIVVTRVSKTVKGGRKMSFSAFAVAGNGNGRIGIGHGKSNEVPVAIEKAMANARKSMVYIHLKEDTLFHKVIAKFGATKLIVMPAPKGTGIIASAPLRAVFEVLGVENAVAKVIGSSNAINVVRAAMRALTQMKSPEKIAEKRGKTVEELMEKAC